MKALLAKLFGMFNQPEPLKPVAVEPKEQPKPTVRRGRPPKGVVAAKKKAVKKAKK